MFIKLLFFFFADVFLTDFTDVHRNLLSAAICVIYFSPADSADFFLNVVFEIVDVLLFRFAVL